MTKDKLEVITNGGDRVFLESKTLTFSNEYSYVIVRNENGKVVGSYYQPSAVSLAPGEPE